jgi:hypothetical protein
VIASARVESSVLDLRLDQKIDGASGCLHSCMHLARLRGDTMEACTACCTARLCTPSVDEFRSQDFGLKLNWEAPMGSTWCILFCLQNGTDKTRVEGSLLTAVARLFRGIDLCRSESMERLDLGGG